MASGRLKSLATSFNDRAGEEGGAVGPHPTFLEKNEKLTKISKESEGQIEKRKLLQIYIGER